MRRLYSASIFLLLILGLACTSGNPTPTTQFDDAVVATRVRTALAADGTIPASSINVLVDRGVVTLRGTVPRSVVDRTIATAARVEGVVSVLNELVVQ